MSYTAAIRSSQTRGQWPHALLWLQDLKCTGISVDMIACSSATRACENQAQWRRAQLLCEFCNVQPDLIAMDSAISAFARKAEWQSAQVLLRSFPVTQIRASVVSFSSAITACEKGNMWPAACLLLQELNEQRMPSAIAFNAAISACEKAGEWELALVLLWGLKKQSLLPHVATSASGSVVPKPLKFTLLSPSPCTDHQLQRRSECLHAAWSLAAGHRAFGLNRQFFYVFRGKSAGSLLRS